MSAGRESLIEARTVTFEGTGEKREVVRDCKVCLSGDELGYGCGIVSPSGIAHIGVYGGDTRCGKDATGDGWWWPL